MENYSKDPSLNQYGLLGKENDYLDEIILSMNSPYRAPEFTSLRTKDYIPYLDIDKKQFPDKLIYYKNNSSLHGAILKNMSDQVAGNGVIINEEGSVQDATKLFLNNFGSKGDDINEVIQKMSDDLCTFKGISLLITWSKDGKKIIHIDHIDFSKIRSGKAIDEGPDKGKIPGYYYSWKWDTQRPNAEFIPIFDKNTMADKKKKYDEAVKRATTTGKVIPELEQILLSPQEQLFYFHPYASNEFYYPLPYYVGAIPAIKTDIASDEYAAGEMENGLSAKHIIIFKGNYTPEAKKSEARAFVKTFVVGVKKSLPIIHFTKDPESTMEVKKIDSIGKDEKYTKINENSMQKILSGHGVTSPMLVGIRTAGSLGGGDELATASALFYRNTIRPKQNIITKIINGFLEINQLDSIKIEQLTLLPENTEIENTETENKEN